jgi:hypothetical protein
MPEPTSSRKKHDRGNPGRAPFYWFALLKFYP